MYRLFVAVDLPDSIRERIVPLCTGLSGARWVPVTQLHLTLKFIGDADEQHFEAIRQQLATITLPAFSLRFSGIGCFPSSRSPRVVWLGLEECPALHQLQQAVESQLQLIGCPREDRPFALHLTLARLRESHPAAYERYAVRHREYSCPSFPVTSFYLYSSKLSAQGAIHRREAVYALAPAGPDR